MQNVKGEVRRLWARTVANVLYKTDTTGSTPVTLINFDKFQGTYSGTGLHGRLWRIRRVPTGWRLEFIDPGDGTATYAGTYSSVDAAQGHAS